MMVLATQLERGMCVIVDGMPYVVEYVQHVKYGKGAAFVRAVLRSELFDSRCERDFNLSARFEVTKQ